MNLNHLRFCISGQIFSFKMMRKYVSQKYVSQKKRLGCMPTTEWSSKHNVDVRCHMVEASKNDIEGLSCKQLDIANSERVHHKSPESISVCSRFRGLLWHHRMLHVENLRTISLDRLTPSALFEALREEKRLEHFFALFVCTIRGEYIQDLSLVRAHFRSPM